MSIFSQKIEQIVSRITDGSFSTYGQVAKNAGFPGAARAVGSLLAKNENPKIPCHKVIKSDFTVGGFRGIKKDSWEKAGFLLKEGVVGVIPTDTIYGIVGAALNREVVEKIYKLRKRAPEKPMIILIPSVGYLKNFGIKINGEQKKILKKIWPGKVSVILSCSSQKFSYLHRGLKTLAFRIPKRKELLDMLKISGPLVAPSANIEGFPHAKNIGEAKNFFGDKVFYLNEGVKRGKPSTLIMLVKNNIEILRGTLKFLR